jgi:hypothetical protein
MKRLDIEYEQGWLEEEEHIPFIQFPTDWKVQVIPPFGDAVVRFRVELPSGKRKSVYLDTRSSLGFFGRSIDVPTPYWEVYPHRGDIARCHRADIEQLLSYIADESEGDDE